MKTLKQIDYMIITELVRNSKFSDRSIARKIHVSQPTVTRRRASLEKLGLLNYTTILDFPKFGYELMALNFFQWKPGLTELVEGKERHQKRVQEFIADNPELILVASGRGLGMTRMAISIHKNYADYENFANMIDAEWGSFLAKFESFLISLDSEGMLRFFDFKPLAKHIMNTHLEPES